MKWPLTNIKAIGVATITAAVEATDTDVQTPVADGNTATTDAGQTVVVFPDDDGSANN